ncbi:MAG: L-seryl-tRNA(Sec) selenium transferase, partial [Desulfobacteraceae bacterium]|nr:L-seryl-tRNA(Sec) selenium transferase [Desulfobacteraceae bacterium]
MNQLNKNKLLRNLPGVDHLIEETKKDSRFNDIPRSIIVSSIRAALTLFRNRILEGLEEIISDEIILEFVNTYCQQAVKPRLVNVINATGVVLHTNLGRALLCEDALENIKKIAASYSNLELNIKEGKRGIRYQAVDELICELTSAQSAIVVNNNAGAVLLALNTIAKGRQVVVSRGELVEIGGSFRIPDVMSKSGCILKEVGTTNRTHLRDYANAVGDETGLFLKVHTSNYKIEGFTSNVPLEEMVSLGKEKNIPVMKDLGSGTLIDFSKYGLPPEPTIADSVATGADVITFSGDKLLGGPQCGIIIGRKATIDEIKKNPLTRALRIDKMTLAALESTLKIYRDENKAVKEIPTLRMLTMSLDETAKKAAKLLKLLKEKIESAAELEVKD